MTQSWVDLAGTHFSNAVKEIVRDCSMALSEGGLGDEDTQCQHLFTSIFVKLQNEQDILTRFLVEDSRIPNLVVEVRYYRSKRRRHRQEKRIQFVESETGADFALSLMVDLPNIAFTQRHVLAQAKLVKASKIRIDSNQLATLHQAAGGELGLYAIWGEDQRASVITIANLKAVIKASEAPITVDALGRFTRPMSDYIVDDFLGLWHGADFHAEEYGETPPKQSPPVLYHLLHADEPPPNVVYFGFIQASSAEALSPRFRVHGFERVQGGDWQLTSV